MKKATGGISFFGLLTAIFIGLKLGGAIDWSWIWVLSPLFIPIGLVIGIVLLSLVISFITLVVRATLIAFKDDRKDD